VGSTQVMLPFIAVKGGEPLSLEYELTRQKLDELIGAMIRSTVEPIDLALKDAKLDRSQISDIVLVGGSSRLKLVRSVIAEIFNKEPRHGVHPDEAIALGAAVQAGLKAGTISADKGIMITDVCPYTLGVEVSASAGRERINGLFSPIIPRNSTVPVSRTETYLTTSDNQRVVEIRVYQGQDRLVKNNTFLDAYSVEGVPAGPAGAEKVAVTFTYDINGILNVKTRVVSTGKEALLAVENTAGRMSEDERDAKREQLEKDWAKPGAAVAPPAARTNAPVLVNPGARALIDRAKVKAATAKSADKARLDSLISRFEQALPANEPNELARLDTELTDLLFELE
jgi:molecular chaperone DnaK